MGNRIRAVPIAYKASGAGLHICSPGQDPDSVQARQRFQLLKEQLLLQKTEVKPILSPHATQTAQKAGQQASDTAVWCNLAFQGKDTSLIKVCACNRGLNSAQFSSSLDQQQQHKLLMCARISPLAGTGLRFTASTSGSANTILSK